MNSLIAKYTDHRKRIMVFGSTFLIFCSCVFGGENQDSIDTVISKWEEYQAQLCQDLCEFTISLKSSVRVITPTEKDSLRPGSWILARSDDQWASQVKALNENNDKNFPDDSNAEIQVAKKGLVFEWRKSDKYCFVHDFDFGWNFFNEWCFFQRLQVNIYDRISETNGQEFENVKKKLKVIAPYSNVFYPFLPDCLKKNKEKYTFRKGFETIDQSPCLVLEWPNHDVIWLDPEFGYLVKKRVIYFEETPIIKYGITNRDFREIKPGLWIPFTQVEDNYADIRHTLKSDWGKIIQRITYNVTSFILEKPSEEMFNPPVQPGNSVRDSKRNMEYTISAPNADPFAGPLNQGIKAARLSILRYILIMAGAIMILIAVWFKLKNRKTQ